VKFLPLFQSPGLPAPYGKIGQFTFSFVAVFHLCPSAAQVRPAQCRSARSSRGHLSVCPSARSASSAALHTSRPGRCTRNPPFNRSMLVLRASCQLTAAAGTSTLACGPSPIIPSGLPLRHPPVSDRPRPPLFPAVDTSRQAPRHLQKPRLSPSSARGRPDLTANYRWNCRKWQSIACPDNRRPHGAHAAGSPDKLMTDKT